MEVTLSSLYKSLILIDIEIKQKVISKILFLDTVQ